MKSKTKISKWKRLITEIQDYIWVVKELLKNPQCGCYITVLTFNLIVGGWSVNYLLDFFINKTIPFWGAVLIGMFSAHITFPIAVIILLLKYFNIL